MHEPGVIVPPGGEGCIAYRVSAACEGEAPRALERGAEIHNVLSCYCTVTLDHLTSLTCARLAKVEIFKITATGSWSFISFSSYVDTFSSRIQFVCSAKSRRWKTTSNRLRCSHLLMQRSSPTLYLQRKEALDPISMTCSAWERRKRQRYNGH
jgi:hypothetical protein